jgi:hypothetical protein
MAQPNEVLTKHMNVRSARVGGAEGARDRYMLTYAINAFDLEPFQGTSPGR